MANDIVSYERDNPTYHAGCPIRLFVCSHCVEWYDPDYEHICKKKNSYIISRGEPLTISPPLKYSDYELHWEELMSETK